MFQHFGSRLKKDLRSIVDRRLAASETAAGGQMRSSGMEVNVISHKMQRYAVWYGGSLLGSLPDFKGFCYTKADYDEHGPSIVRKFSVSWLTLHRGAISLLTRLILQVFGGI